MANKKQSTKPAPPSAGECAAPVAAEPDGGSLSRIRCPVAAFGASAGGLEAFREVLEALPLDSGIAFIFIMHLDPKHESILPSLLRKATRMPVVQAQHGLRVQPDHVYVIPPNVNLGIHEGVLQLENRPSHVQHMPIDHFFRMLAREMGNKAVGVILSGTASDGTFGLKAIKVEGGITFAQDDRSAKYNGMPRSAVAAGCVDFVLPPQQIARELVRLCRHPYVAHEDGAGEPEPATEPQQEFDEIFGMLRKATAVDFNLYKQGTLKRRIERRMALQKIDKPARYVQLLREQPSELQNLFQDILINVTSFFREPVTFEALRTKVFPALVKDREREDSIRIWVPGCSTGEEVYSVAIVLLEFMRETNSEFPVQLFGTDLSDGALERARAGVYPESVASEISPERLRRFFHKVNHSYQISRLVRDVCIFAKQNVTRDPPFSRIDVITCRNLLIYLGPVLQAKVIRVFHYALKPKGFLVLGLSETVGAATNLFTPLEKQKRIYTRKPVRTPVPEVEEYDTPQPTEPARKTAASQPGEDVHQIMDHLLLARYSPPAVLVDRNLRIVEFRGQTAPFLEHTSGEANLNLMKMAQGGLGLEIRKLVQRADKSIAQVRSDPIPYAAQDEVKELRVSVSPVQSSSDSERHFLVVFETAIQTPWEEEETGKRRGGKGASRGADATTRVRRLEYDLSATKSYLQSIIEEQEASSEELKSANEEVQSSNEELQSTNEELLTAKEELQSANEELTTVNEEMLGRNSELNQTNNDLINLLSSVNIPILMLDSDLNIRRFTPQAEKIFNLLAADVGRPVGDLRAKINVPDLGELCSAVIESLVARDREVQDVDGRYYSMWIRPYRTAENRIDGVVIALFDMTERKQASEARYRRLFEAAKDGVLIAEVNTGEIIDCNPYLSKLTGYARSELTGRKFWECRMFERSGLSETAIQEMLETEALHQSLVLTSSKDDPIEVELIGNIYSEGERKVLQFNIRDVSARRRLEEKLRRNEEESRQAHKMEAVGRLAGGVAHDFNNLLTAILGYSEILKQDLGPDHPGYNDAQQIILAGERAALVTRQLLAFGRKQILQPQILDLNTVITELRQIIDVSISKNVKVELVAAPDLGTVRSDRMQIEQVVLNLLLNARDSMPEGGRVTITTANVDVKESFSPQHPTIPAGRYVSLTVTDTGTGMDEETQAHLFDPFFTTKPKGSGTGLGLASIYGTVKQSGGHVRAYSELGVGSTFIIYLPRLDEKAKETSREAAPSTLARGTETILLVEDEHVVRSLAAKILKSCGYGVIEAGSGPEALQASRAFKGRIHLLLTDVIMPQMSGREVADRLHSERPDMRVLYVSGHTEDAIVHHGVLAPDIAFLPKPFTSEALAAKVRGVLDEGKEAKVTK